jgi:hypothetical protein
MKNKYEIQGDITVIYLRKRDGSIHKTIIDTSDLEKIKDFPNTWGLCWNRMTNSYYSQGTLYLDNKKTKTIQLHRFLMGLESGNKRLVDHKNHDTLDNRRSCNLRVVNNVQNGQNRKGANARSKTGIRGVSWHKQHKKWYACVNLRKKQKYIGLFEDIKEAEKAVEKERKKLMKSIGL